MKTCNKCGDQKPPSGFAPRRNKCKKCEQVEWRTRWISRRLRDGGKPIRIMCGPNYRAMHIPGSPLPKGKDPTPEEELEIQERIEFVQSQWNDDDRRVRRVFNPGRVIVRMYSLCTGLSGSLAIDEVALEKGFGIEDML